MRILATIALSLTAITAAPAFAHKHRTPSERQYLKLYHQARERHGTRAPGCNLITNRYRNHCHGRTTKADIRRSTATLKRMLYVPPPTPVHASTTSAPSTTYTPSTTAGTGFESIRQCESGGDYNANTGNGYYGAYQFDLQTWQSVGGTGLPSNASPAEQDARAQALYSQRGSNPWPVCGG